MSNFNRILLTIAISFCSLQISAAEIDLDVQVEIPPAVRGQLISEEGTLKDHRIVLNEEKGSIGELLVEFEEAAIADNKEKLQNIFRILLPKLWHIQNMLALYDGRVEQYRWYVFQAMQNAERKKTSLKGSLPNEKSTEIDGAIYEQMSKENQTSLGPRVAKILNARKKLKELNDVSDKIPGSPYGSIQGLSIKHVIAGLDRIQLKLEREHYAQLEAIVIGLIELYTSKELLSEKITENDHNRFLDSLNYLIDDTVKLESDPAENPYLQVE